MGWQSCYRRAPPAPRRYDTILVRYTIGAEPHRAVQSDLASSSTSVHQSTFLVPGATPTRNIFPSCAQKDLSCGTCRHLVTLGVEEGGKKSSYRIVYYMGKILKTHENSVERIQLLSPPRDRSAVRCGAVAVDGGRARSRAERASVRPTALDRPLRRNQPTRLGG